MYNKNIIALIFKIHLVRILKIYRNKELTTLILLPV